MKPPVEKARKEKENPAGAHPPGGSRQYVGGSAPPIPPSRRQGRNGLFSLPQMRAPSGSPASARPSRTRRQTGCPSVLVEEVRAAPRAQIARGAATQALRAPGTRGPAQILKKTLEGPQARPQGWRAEARPGASSGGESRAPHPSGFSVSALDRHRGQAEAVVERGLHPRAEPRRREASESVGPARIMQGERAGRPRLLPSPGRWPRRAQVTALLGSGSLAGGRAGQEAGAWGGPAGGSGSGRAAPRPGARAGFSRVSVALCPDPGRTKASWVRRHGPAFQSLPN